jgi:Arc/MetJ-type ribon-helix-helix transcriptional regulator
MVRTSISLDDWTIQTIKSLSEKLGISKSDVIRRSVSQFQKQTELKELIPPPLEALDWLQNGGGMLAEEAAEYLAEIEAERAARTYWWES